MQGAKLLRAINGGYWRVGLCGAWVLRESLPSDKYGLRFIRYLTPLARGIPLASITFESPDFSLALS